MTQEEVDTFESWITGRGRPYHLPAWGRGITPQNTNASGLISSKKKNMKYREVIKEIKEKKIFGDVIAMIYVIEFQKRGLPHMHLVIWLRPDQQPTV